MTSEDKDNKIKNLDSFFSMNKEESPKSQSPTFKFDYNQIMTSFEHNQEYQFIIEFLNTVCFNKENINFPFRCFSQNFP